MIYIMLIMLVILFIQAPSLVIYRQWWDLAVFLFFWLNATIYSLIVAADTGFPNPSDVVISVVEFIGSLLSG